MRKSRRMRDEQKTKDELIEELLTSDSVWLNWKAEAEWLAPRLQEGRRGGPGLGLRVRH
jgi:hypothetical protein